MNYHAHMRQHLTFGEGLALSIQAHCKYPSRSYCSPEVDSLPWDAYDTVEIAVMPSRCTTNLDGTVERDHNVPFIRPSAIGVTGYDDFFETIGKRPVAGEVPISIVKQLIDDLTARFGAPTGNPNIIVC